MHQTRKEASSKLPIRRKGTKYLARALSDVQNSVPVVIAVRDMLNLARTAREVNEMIKQKHLKINGRIVEDNRESIKLFDILEAGKKYSLILLSTGRFAFVEAKSDSRLTKVVSRRLISGGKLQLNLNEGSNLIGKSDIVVGDSLYLDAKGKISKHVKMEKGKEAFVYSGKYIGLIGKIHDLKGNKVTLKFPKKEELVELSQSQIMVQ